MSSESRIRRDVRSVAVTLFSASASVSTIRLDDMSGGVVSLGTMQTAATSLQMWGAIEEAGPYRRLYKADGSAADVTLAASTADGRIYSLPDEVFALPFLRVVIASAAGTGAAGVVSLKS